MDRSSLRSVWSLPASVGLSLALATLGTFWVLGQSPRLPASDLHGASAYGVQPDHLGRVADTSDLILEGVVTEVYPSEWTTPDKNPPLRLADTLTDDRIQLRTPVLIDVDEVYKGEAVPGTLLFTLPGGRQGGVTVSSPFGMAPVKGDRIVVFLSKAPKEAGPWAEISPLYPQLFFVVDGQSLIGPDTTITYHKLAAQLGIEG